MNGERCRELRALHAPYATGRLEARDELRIQAHLAQGCSRCAAEIDALMELFARLGTLLPEEGLPASSTAALLAAAEGRAQQQPGSDFLFPETNTYKLMVALLCCAALAVAAVTWWASGLQGRLGDAERALGDAESQTRLVVGQYRALQGERDELRRLRAASLDERLQAHELLADGGALTAPVGCVYIDPATREAAVQLDHYPDLPGSQRLLLHFQGSGEDSGTTLAAPPGQAGEPLSWRFSLPEGLPLEGSSLVLMAGEQRIGWSSAAPSSACSATRAAH